jgi:hypothetical protein
MNAIQTKSIPVKLTQLSMSLSLFLCYGQIVLAYWFILFSLEAGYVAPQLP